MPACGFLEKRDFSWNKNGPFYAQENLEIHRQAGQGRFP